MNFSHKKKSNYPFIIQTRIEKVEMINVKPLKVKAGHNFSTKLSVSSGKKKL